MKMDIKELTKGDVYVVVDTPKKAKKLKKVLDMFGEEVYEGKVSHDDGYPYFTYVLEFNLFVGCKYERGSNIADKTKVSIKELRNILAKEHLKKGDYVVCEEDGDVVVGVFKEWEFRFGFEIENCYYLNDKYKDYNSTGGCFDNFKRYATPDEVALLEPKPKELAVGKWFLFSGHTVKHPPLMLITKNNGSYVRFCGFNFVGKWVDDDSYSLEVLKECGYREATPQEVETDLAEEAKRRYKVGDKISYDSVEYTLDFKSIVYLAKTNQFFMSVDNEGRSIQLFKNGKWAEIIEQDKFAELKEAHKNGAVIQCKVGNGSWSDCEPKWSIHFEYRIKPEEKPKVGDVFSVHLKTEKDIQNLLKLSSYERL